jgi:hypothetical protein
MKPGFGVTQFSIELLVPWMQPCLLKRAFASGRVGTEAFLFDYYDMQGHMNRRKFTRCAWSAALMLAGSAAAVLGTISYLAK